MSDSANELELTTTDGLRLRGLHWASTQVPPRGHVVIVHGLGEHAGRYAPLAGFLALSGWSVTAFDQRGHGRSPGRRGDIAEADSLLQDLAVVIDQERGRVGAGRLILLGHSLGGVVTARFVAEGLARRPARWWRAVDALALSSPALDPGMDALQKALLVLTQSLLPHLPLGNSLKPAWISRDTAVVRAYANDPLVHNRVTPALVSFALDAGVLVQQRAAHWNVRTLLLWAGADRCVAPRGSAVFAAAAPAGLLTAKVYPSLFHEIFNEPEREQVWADLIAWLNTL